MDVILSTINGLLSVKSLIFVYFLPSISTSSSSIFISSSLFSINSMLSFIKSFSLSIENFSEKLSIFEYFKDAATNTSTSSFFKPSLYKSFLKELTIFA